MSPLIDGPERRAMRSALMTVSETTFFQGQWVETGEMLRSTAIRVASAAANVSPHTVTVLIEQQGKPPYRLSKRPMWVENALNAVMTGLYRRSA